MTAYDSHYIFVPFVSYTMCACILIRDYSKFHVLLIFLNGFVYARGRFDVAVLIISIDLRL